MVFIFAWALGNTTPSFCDSISAKQFNELADRIKSPKSYALSKLAIPPTFEKNISQTSLSVRDNGIGNNGYLSLNNFTNNTTKWHDITTSMKH